MYKSVDPKVSFPKMEESVLEFWQKNDVFKESIRQREGAEEYVFYDGPPFATGLPHFGHFVPGTIKDIIPRYQTMKGKKVDRRFGWDCHGLPVEYEMEKSLGISGAHEIETYGVAKFNEQCRGIVQRYVKEWETTITRMGRWVDFRNDYKTMDVNFMESIWWVFKQLWDKGYVYEGHYILPYSPALSTPLSNFEVNLGEYKEVHDPAITVRFKLKEFEGSDNTYILAWTTTPWTLPSNLGLCLGPEIDYVRLKDKESGDFYIVAEARISAYFKSEEDYEILAKYKGKDLMELEYEPLFPYFKDTENAFKTINAEYVTTEDGTGIVHIAPGFGEDDYNAMKARNVETICPIDKDARFTEEVTDFVGLFVKDADKPIIQKLKDEGKLVKREQYLHRYPHCYRSKKPLIYRAISSWFVNIDKIKDKMIAANQKINWVPEHLKNGRFGKWLEGARDWAISRNRYWGNPIPVWRCDVSGEMICVGSREELEKLSGKKVDDLHKHFVDDITFPSPAGGTYRRVPEVLDCWFESGSMPYAQQHYPFENKEHFEANFPADFICEGIDQTRGWFYTLTILAAALFESPAFMNNITNGLVLAEDGKKMSKSERNFTDPNKVIDTFGADALRMFLMSGNVVKAGDLKYSDDGVKEILKSVILPLWNAYSFYVTYANIDKAQPTQAPDNPSNPLDKWILSEVEKLVADVTAALDGYDMQQAVTPIVEFIDVLNNWYIRRSRRRFWRSENDNDKNEAYETLYSVLLKLVTVASPIIPFVTEEIYQNLRSEDMPLSVHLQDYPVEDKARRDEVLERKMALTQQTVSMGRTLRAMHKIKTRQPLGALHLVTLDSEEKGILREMEDIIREELNVKEVQFRENEDELVEYSAKANFKVLGKQLGPKMKAAAAEIAKLQGAEISSLLDGATLAIDVDGESFEITEESVMVQRSEKENLKVLNEGTLTLALETEITKDLLLEGMVRDLVRGVQNHRKESDLQVTDRIKLFVDGSELLKEAVQKYREYLCDETLTAELVFGSGDNAVNVECGEEECAIALSVASI